jgi:hypothetical protein
MTRQYAYVGIYTRGVPFGFVAANVEPNRVNKMRDPARHLPLTV